jgi:nucleotide-binding universal stress UspA family protein
VSSSERKPLLVGIGASDGHGAALCYAADAASRESRGVVLVHVLPAPSHGTPEAALLTSEAAGLVAEDLLHRARDRLLALDGGLEVEAMTRRGQVTDVLVELGRSADRVVLEHRQQSRLHRVFNGSVAARVAARSPVPVVSVPEFWASWTEGHPHLTVGVHGDDSDGPVLDRAFAAASSLQGTLTVLHAWSLPPLYDAAVVDRAALRVWGLSLRDLVTDGLETRRTAHPDLEVRVDVVHMRTVDALVNASRHSDLLLLGRSGQPQQPTRLGSSSRVLIRESLCPVEIVATGPSRSGPRHLVAPAAAGERGDATPVHSRRGSP